MVSDASKKREAQKKAAAAAKRAGKSGASAKQVKEAAAAAFASATSTGADNGKADGLANGIGELQISDRTCTGVLCSHPLSRDIRVSLYPRSNLYFIQSYHFCCYCFFFPF